MIRWGVVDIDENDNLRAIGKTDDGRWAVISVPAGHIAQWGTAEYRDAVEIADYNETRRQLESLGRHTTDESLIAFIDAALDMMRGDG